MTTENILPVRDRTGSSDRALHRTAGLGALLAAVSYAVQPLLVLTASDYQENAQYLLDTSWQGAAEALVFTGLAAGFALLVIAVGELWRRRGAGSPGARLAELGGLAAAGAWLLVGGSFAGLFGSASNLAEAAPDPAGQALALHVHSTDGFGLIATALLGTVGWLAGVATVGRRVTGLAGAVVAVVAALVMLVPLLVWSIPFGVLVLIPALLVLGALLLVRASRIAA